MTTTIPDIIKYAGIWNNKLSYDLNSIEEFEKDSNYGGEFWSLKEVEPEGGYHIFQFIKKELKRLGFTLGGSRAHISDSYTYNSDWDYFTTNKASFEEGKKLLEKYAIKRYEIYLGWYLYHGTKSIEVYELHNNTIVQLSLVSKILDEETARNMSLIKKVIKEENFELLQYISDKSIRDFILKCYEEVYYLNKEVLLKGKTEVISGVNRNIHTGYYRKVTLLEYIAGLD